jgi:putative salt-induced outer membrane protein
MNRLTLRPLVVFIMIMAVATASAAAAQTTTQPPAPGAPTQPATPAWTGSAGLGFSMNRGNTSTTNFNVSFAAASDAKKPGVWKFKAIYLRDETDGALSADRLLADARYERTLSTRVYAFGAVGFLEDQFKSIDYLLAPAAGIGYKLVNTEQTTFNADAGLGVKIEKNTNSDATTDFGVTLGDKFEHKLSKDSSITQGFTALWEADDFGDAVYTFTSGVAAALTRRTQIKLELLDAYIARPPSSEIKKNDVSFITSLLYKF